MFITIVCDGDEHEPMEIDENIAVAEKRAMPLVLPIQANDGDEHEPMEIDENIAVPQEGAIPLFRPIHQASDEHEPMEIDDRRLEG